MNKNVLRTGLVIVAAGISGGNVPDAFASAESQHIQGNSGMAYAQPNQEQAAQSNGLDTSMGHYAECANDALNSFESGSTRVDATTVYQSLAAKAVDASCNKIILRKVKVQEFMGTSADTLSPNTTQDTADQTLNSFAKSVTQSPIAKLACGSVIKTVYTLEASADPATYDLRVMPNPSIKTYESAPSTATCETPAPTPEQAAPAPSAEPSPVSTEVDPVVIVNPDEVITPIEQPVTEAPVVDDILGTLQNQIKDCKTEAIGSAMSSNFAFGFNNKLTKAVFEQKVKLQKISDTCKGLIKRVVRGQILVNNGKKTVALTKLKTLTTSSKSFTAKTKQSKKHNYNTCDNTYQQKVVVKAYGKDGSKPYKFSFKTKPVTPKGCSTR